MATTDKGHPPKAQAAGLFGWYREATPEARRSLFAASLGWMLDAFDVMLYSLVLADIKVHFGMSDAMGGLLGSLTLAASAIGGVAFGFFADRLGRARALMASILVYSVFTAACGLSQSVLQLATFRFILGFGMGGEWTSGAALVSETWPDRHRGKAMAFMQSFWAIGYGAAALVSFLAQEFFPQRYAWRLVFFIGILPALLTFWIRRRIPEPEIWKRRIGQVTDAAPRRHTLRDRGLRGITIWVTLMNALTLFAYWGFNFWNPTYLSRAPERGLGCGPGMKLALLIVLQIGMWFGYLTFGYVSDRWGRRRTYLAYLFAATACMALYSILRWPAVLFLLGPLVGFFGTGYFSGFGAVTAELYPTAVRATLQGITYNTGRIVSAVAPFLLGTFSDRSGYAPAFLLVAAAFFLAACCWIFIPETRGRSLE